MKVSSKRSPRTATSFIGKRQDILYDDMQSDGGFLFSIANPEPSLAEYLEVKDHQDELERRELFVVG